jgi:hypothetical protein
VERYLSPKDGMTHTIRFPLFSGREPTRIAAKTEAPEEIPQNIPSSVASLRAMPIASAPETCTTSSIKDVSQFPGMKPAPIPWILCGPGDPPDSTADSSGSTAIICNSGFRGFKYCAHPVRVPPVPTPPMRISTFPSVSAQISGPVVSLQVEGEQN